MEPLVRLLPVDVHPPSLRDNTGDIDRLKRGLAPLLGGALPVVPHRQLAAVARAFRQAGFKGTAVLNDLPAGPELVDFLVDMPAVLPAMALDLGTTQLEASLVDLLTGRVLARITGENPQIVEGADILTRIHFAGRGDGLAVLHAKIIATVNKLAVDLSCRIGVSPDAIRALTVAGNTTMVHFFLKLDPFHLCREPYIPVANAPDPCPAVDLNLTLHPAAVVWVLPGVGSYFGGDLLAGILATDLDLSEQTAMLIDVGTNAEVVVGNRDWLIACAGAAGPALEGGVARMGMRAGPGAIEHVTIDPVTGTLRYKTIDDEKPCGICGSGMIDLVAGLYLARIIDLRGKFRQASGSRRLLAGPDGGYAFVVAEAGEAALGQPVLLDQVDLDALMRSKAAMYAILTTLINQVGLTCAQLERIYVAGAFGQHIAPRQAIVLGMLPDLPIATFKSVGNSSLAGAQKMLVDQQARQRSLALVRKITYIELNVNQEFMIRFSGSRFIPHTDRGLFPSVPHFRDEEA